MSPAVRDICYFIYVTVFVLTRRTNDEIAAESSTRCARALDNEDRLNATFNATSVYQVFPLVSHYCEKRIIGDERCTRDTPRGSAFFAPYATAKIALSESGNLYRIVVI